MRVGMRIFGRIPPASSGRRRWRLAGVTLLMLGCFILGMAWHAMAQTPSVEVRNLGISRTGERTMLTVILSQAANPQLLPFTGANRAQLVIDFPGAQATHLPESLPGDEALVKGIKTEVSDSGVKIILEMFPDRPYLMHREITPLKGGLAMFRLGLRADTSATPASQPPPAAAPVPPSQPTPVAPPEPPPTPAAPAAPAPGGSGPPPSGEFAEIYQLVPQARGLWDFLRGDGWTVAKSQNFDSPGQRASRAFDLTNPRYPEMHIRIAHLLSAGPGVPNISIVDLTMDNLTGRAPDKYRELRKWNFGQIKAKYEDIGDFFEDALKPLRVDIRKECQTLAQRRSQFITDYLRQAVPQNPRLADQAITLIRKKVSPRFEGVQYTLSDNPLTILNLVDFTYIRVYYLGR
jgi:cell division septation protein DedD